MLHSSITMSFQQELIALVDGYQLNGIADFDRLPPEDKHYFVTRLYKCFERGLDNLADDLSAFGGLKLAYERSLTETSSRFEDTTFKKFALYSSHAVVSCPIEETSGVVKPSKSKRMEHRERFDSASIRELRQSGKYVFGDVKAHKRTHGGEIHVQGKAYIVERAAVARLIETVIGLRDALRHGVVHVVPCLPDTKLKLRADLRNSGVVSGNFSRPSLVRQFREDAGTSRHLAESGVLSIYLPHLSNVPLAEILEIRNREAAAYSAFQAALTQCVGNTPRDFSEQKLEQYMRDLDEAIKLLRARYEQLERRYQHANRERLVRLFAFALVLVAPAEVAAALLPVLGGFSAWDYSTARTAHHHELGEAVSTQFYLPWSVDVLSRAH